MKIKLSDLIPLCELIIKQASNQEIQEINLDLDFYRSIDPDDLYTIKQERPRIVTNSLEDDWEGLQNVLSGEEPVVTFDFIRYANVMKLVASAVKNSDTP